RVVSWRAAARRSACFSNVRARRKPVRSTLPRTQAGKIATSTGEVVPSARMAPAWRRRPRAVASPVRADSRLRSRAAWAVFRGNDFLERVAAEELGPRVPEHAARRGVELQDPALVVDGHDRIEGGVEDHGLAQLAGPQLLLPLLRFIERAQAHAERAGDP